MYEVMVIKGVDGQPQVAILGVVVASVHLRVLGQLTCRMLISQTKEGASTSWGDRSFEELFGPKGWCVADQPFEGPYGTFQCIIDGLDGPLCDQVSNLLAAFLKSLWTSAPNGP